MAPASESCKAALKFAVGLVKKMICIIDEKNSGTTSGATTSASDQSSGWDRYDDDQDEALKLEYIRLRDKVKAHHAKTQKDRNPQEASPPKPLTFGIEFEFVLAATVEKGYGHAPSPFNPLCLLTLDLRASDVQKIVRASDGSAPWANLSGTDFDDSLPWGIQRLTDDTFNTLFNKNHVIFAEPEWNSTVSKGWWNKLDSSIRFPGAYQRAHWSPNMPWSDVFFYWGTEVVSPILPATSSGFEEARHVAHVLDTQIRSEVNRSCGLHVHVGNGKSGFDLDTLTNVIGILWVFDRQIIRLHPKFRKSLGGSTYCRSICGGVLGRWPKSGAIKAKLLEFYTAETAFELNCMLGHPGRYTAYNFTNLSKFSNGIRPHIETIEFRQHEGTLKGNRAKNWAKFCVAIVEWAMMTSKEAMQQFLLAEHQCQQTGGGMHIWELARFLKLDDVADAFKEFVEEKEQLRDAKRELNTLERQLHALVDVLGVTPIRDVAASTPIEDEILAKQAERYKYYSKYYKLANIHYDKGANTPDSVVPYDSDDDSEYGDEVAYYGKAGVEPAEPLKVDDSDCFGADQIVPPAKTWCPRCRPDLAEAAAHEEIAVTDPGLDINAVPKGWEGPSPVLDWNDCQADLDDW